MKFEFCNKKTMILLIGVQASGKSSFYREFFAGEYEQVSLDILHTRNKERIKMEQCLEQGMGFVVDNTNPTQADRERYIAAAKRYGYQVVGYYFQSCVGDCMERNERREGKARVSRCAIAATYKKLELPDYKEGFDLLYYVAMEKGGWKVADWQEDGEDVKRKE